MSRSTWHPAALMLACVPGATLVTAGAAQPKAPVRVPLQDLTDKKVGSLELRERGGGLEFRIRVTGLSAGGHGMHIHAIGVCSPPEFESAGSHLNPFRRQHGHHNPWGPHLGDLGNLMVGRDGSADTAFVVQGLTLLTGPNSIRGEDGFSAFILHQRPDDQSTDPSGNSGRRVVCGVIEGRP